MASKGLVLFVGMLGGAAALATGKPADIHNDAVCGVICVDSINDCGQKYGGCYDPCVDPAPTAPPCLAPYTNIWYPTPPPEEIIPFTDEEGEDCSKIIVCVDGITECGIPFGACIPDCKPWNITIPTCPEIPDTPETPETPDTPDTPDTPETPDTTETAPSVAVEAPEQPDDLGEIAPWIPGRRVSGRREAVEEPEQPEDLGEVVPWTPEPKGQV